MMRTSASHIGRRAAATASRRRGKSGFQTRPAGNAVNLEDQMLKVSANQMDYRGGDLALQPQPRAAENRIGKR